MSKVIITKNDDGSCEIIVPTLWALSFMTIEQIAEKDSAGKPWRIIDVDKLPEDWTFRNAWTDDYDTDTVDVDMTKAVDLHKDTLRALRKPKLEALDVAYMKALETNDPAAIEAVKVEKQTLRDVTNQEWPSTSDELKNFIPDCLK